MDRQADPRVADLVQAGKLRVALFLPQFIEEPATGQLRGLGTGAVGTELARLLAARLGVEVEMAGYPTPASVVESLKIGASDLAFMGIEPSRTTELDFSPAMFEFDYTLLVPAGSAIHDIADADRPGVRIAIVRNHASSLALSRIVRHAELAGAELPNGAFAELTAGRADALAFPRDVLLDYSGKLPGSRVLEAAYGANRVGIVIRKGQPGRLAYITEFVEEAKASGLIQQAIETSRVRGFRQAEGAGVQRR
jgi:polar amino acid transport system substrate-binding protein